MDAPPDNPLLDERKPVRFDRLQPEHAVPAMTAMLETAEQHLAALEAGTDCSWDGLMEPLADLEAPLEFAWDVIGHMLSVMNAPAWREAHEALQPRLIAFSQRLLQSRPLFARYRTLRDQPGLTGVQQRVLAALLRRAELAGVGLEPGAAQRFNAIQTELAREGTAFSNTLLDASRQFALNLTTPAEIDGMPDSLLAAASAAAREADAPDSTPSNGPWRITLEIPLFMPFMEHSRRSDLREQLYRAYITRAAAPPHDNRDRIATILRLRREAARLLGYDTYAEVSLTEKMAGSVEAVDTLIDRLHQVAYPAALREREALEAFAREQGGPADGLRHWDMPFWAERMREVTFGFTSETLRPYFQLPRVLDGLFARCRQLFDVTITPADGEVPVWHPDVRCFRIATPDQPPALFYLDPYSRPATKRGGAWMNPARPRRRYPDGSLDTPVAYLVCNQTLPQGDKPSLMTFNEVTTLFHEFGHALQHLLTTVDDPRAAGIHNIEWDAVETASQFMENWCYHWPTLQGMTAHIDTGEPLPRDLFERICKARTFRAASAICRQLAFAALDIELHHRFEPTGNDDPDAVKTRIAARYLPLPLLPEDRFLCGFQHIFHGGYAAGYYSYKWAEVLAADAYAAFEEAGLDDPAALAATGRRFRDTILAQGGGAHPMAVFKAFRGREPDPDALLRQAGLAG